MEYKEFVVHQTELAYEALLRTARAVPEDKLKWQPFGQGRSVFDQVRECALSPRWLSTALRLRDLPAAAAERLKFMEESRQWTTLDQLEEVARLNMDVMFVAIRECPENELEQLLELQPGIEHSLRECMLLPMMNAVYHTGQINYIQTLYGDFEWHVPPALRVASDAM